MLNRLIQWSLAHRPLVLGLSMALLVFGIQSALRLPVEVLPDLTKPTVIILTESPGLAPEEVETRVTQPLESALLGVPGLTRLRSNSDVALSLNYAEFNWGTDIYHARVLVQERLQSAREQLPAGVEPFMTPVASLMGEILLVGVRSTVSPEDPDYLSPAEVRTLADWTIRRRLQTIPGIAEVLNMGGGVRQIEVQPDPYLLQAHDVSFAELETAIAHAATTTTGGFIETGPTEIMVRNLAMTTSLPDIGQTVVKLAGDRPVVLDDVAEVVWGIEPMRGDASVSRSPEKRPTYGVIMSITKTPGFDTRELTDHVTNALDDLRLTLPPGIETIPLFQQKSFIDRAIGNLREAIRDGAIMVVVVLFLFLLNFRTTFITLTAMPMSFAITLLTFRCFDITVNSMTLGGLAVAIGMVVDDAIVDVENVFRRLRENANQAKPKPRIEVIAAAASEVRNSILYATLLVILVFLPLLGLSGVEGRLFAPIAMATMISMAASFIVSITLIPVLCSLLLRPKGGQPHPDGLLVRLLKALLRKTFLRAALFAPLPVLLLVLTGMAAAFSLYPQMGKDFLPSFREETALIAVTSAPGTSLMEMNQISDAIETQILAVPEVRQVGRRLGRAERGDHVVPVSTAEFDIDFGDPIDGSPAREREAVLADLNQRLKTVPGTFSAIGGPLADRIGHMLSGVAAPVAIKVFGPDLDTLRQIGTQVRTVAQRIPGFESAKLDQQAFIPQLRIEADRARAAAYGVTPGALNEQVGALVGGKVIAELREGQRTLNLVLRLPPTWRESTERIERLPVETTSGQRVPLASVANVREARGPNVIFRENSQRRFTIAIKPSVRDVSTLVEQLKSDIQVEVALPEGYFITFEGEFEAREEASQRIAVLSAVVLLLITLLLYGYFKSWSLTLQVMLNIPLALVGGLVLTWLMLDNISIATLVGFIAVGGIAARNGIMMISHYLHLMRHEGEEFTRSMIERGTTERMVPVLMTALSAGIALIPFLLAGDQPGKEILHPVAVVIVGGLVSSTLLDFLVTPLVFFHLGKKAALKALARGTSAAI
ncbi:MAG: efflux RND transporter permease subunit [Opitutaceae bacterium]|nr:efflux RND transporter permease subunit [Opitutaceae bacterium]